MRAEPSSPPVEFRVFCQVVRTWLSERACLDPALAAVADLVQGTAVAESDLAQLVAAAVDSHLALGARALLELWSEAQGAGGQAGNEAPLQ